MKKDIYKRFEIIEGHLPVYRSELYKLMENNEQRLLQKIKDIKEAVEATMLTNFQVLDERVDKFSELVDANLETLRKAIADNRDVYVSVINKTNLEQEERMNGFVEDLENIVNELYEVQTRMDSGNMGAKPSITGPPNPQMDMNEIAKQLHDLEAHLNTSIITEKSVRKAQDKYLAEEIDKMTKQIMAVIDKLRIMVDEDGNVIDKNRNKTENDVNQARNDIVELQEACQGLRVELNDINERIERGQIGRAAAPPDNTELIRTFKQEVESVKKMINEKDDNEYANNASLD